MFPEWIIKILEQLGLAGAVIFFLLSAVAGLVGIVRSMQAKADKVYGYRLQERDTLNKTLSDNGRLIEDFLRISDERNDLTEQQSELISKQAQAFEILKITVLSQYDNIREHNQVAAQAIAALAESVRVLTSITVENRSITLTHVSNVQSALNDQKTEVVKCIRDSADTQLRETRTLMENIVARIASWRKRAAQ